MNELTQIIRAVRVQDFVRVLTRTADLFAIDDQRRIFRWQKTTIFAESFHDVGHHVHARFVAVAEYDDLRKVLKPLPAVVDPFEIGASARN